MEKKCSQCGQKFEITQDDLAFYEKVSPEIGGKKYLIPPPTLCPECRQQQRFAFRNEWKFYHRKCDQSGKQLISIYSPDKPYKVYEPVIWWSDVYDPLSYGRAFDFSRPFFEQFAELNRKVPKSAIQNANSENCDYTNYSAENKNCYLVIGGLGARDCLYSYRVFYSSDLVDCYDLIKCERCYECSESDGLHSSSYCSNSSNCSDCVLCDNCIGCRDCFGCANLRNKRFHIYNTPFTEAEYRKKIATLRPGDPAIRRDIEKLHKTVPHRFARLIQCESSTGDQLLECQRCTDSYTLKHSQDCRFCAIGENDRDCMDANFFDNSELLYQSTNLEKNYHILFSVLVWYSKECMYCMNCFNSQNLFGCSGMKKHRYSILNKQYSKEEYENLVPKIIEHMKKTGEWAQFFPPSISPFGYNETIAQEYYPLNKSEAIKCELQWHDEEMTQEKYLGPAITIPDISDADDSICQKILTCDVTGKPYKIIPQELKFYREMNIPIPRKCPDQRHKERMAQRNPRKLWKRECMKCKKEIQTTYSPERSETVLCEPCYLETIY